MRRGCQYRKIKRERDANGPPPTIKTCGSMADLS